MERSANTGYLHPYYAASLSEYGNPRLLPLSRGWVLERSIPGSWHKDAMGSYPIFACEDWSQLQFDLEAMQNELVTVALVADPFGSFTVEGLQGCFQDVVVPFKEHHVTDLARPSESFISKHHRYYAKKVFRQVSIEVCSEPGKFIDEWTTFYRVLAERHNLKGIRAFSKTAFEQQLCVPGIVMFRALSEKRAVGAHIWYVQGDVAYSHLSAFSHDGYNLMASYALYSFAIEYFRDKVQWLDLGSGAGTASTATDGLSKFKKGWATGTRPVYFCGRIFNHSIYDAIVKASNVGPTSYFPAYRHGEFGGSA